MDDRGPRRECPVDSADTQVHTCGRIRESCCDLRGRANDPFAGRRRAMLSMKMTMAASHRRGPRDSLVAPRAQGTNAQAAEPATQEATRRSPFGARMGWAIGYLGLRVASPPVTSPDSFGSGMEEGRADRVRHQKRWQSGRKRGWRPLDLGVTKVPPAWRRPIGWGSARSGRPQEGRVVT